MPDEFEFRLGRYWLGQVSGSRSWYYFWYDSRIGEIRRRSLKITDLDQAKLELASIVFKEGSGKAAEPSQVSLMSVLSNYWEKHSDKTSAYTKARLAGAKALDFVGEDAKVSAFTKARQREFIKKMHLEGYAINTINSWMTFINAALNFAVADDDEETGAALLTRAPKIIYSSKNIAATLNEPEPEPRRWHPDISMIAKLLDGLLLPKEEPIRRFIILMIGFAARPGAVHDSGPFSLDHRYRLIRLNPPKRRQTKKHRPTIPVAEVLWPLLTEEWADGGTFTHVNGKRRTDWTAPWNRARDRIGLPGQFIPYALRHFMATELRHAHLRYGVPRVPKEEREMFMGHRRLTINDGYGEFEPDYLDAAKAAVNAILIAVDAACKQPFLRQSSAKTARPEAQHTSLKLLK